jgi:hypothetical protein
MDETQLERRDRQIIVLRCILLAFDELRDNHYSFEQLRALATEYGARWKISHKEVEAVLDVPVGEILEPTPEILLTGERRQ